MTNQPRLDAHAVPAGYVAREVRNHLIVVRLDVEQALNTLLTRSFEELIVLRGARRVTTGRAGPVHFPAVPGSPDVFVRPYAHGGALGGALGTTFRDPGRAFRELAVTARAQTLELPVPPLVAVTATRRAEKAWTMLAWSWWLPNATALSLTLPGFGAVQAVRRDLLKAVAEAIRRCHDAGLRHADLNSRNILIERAPDAWRVRLIDLDKTTFGEPLKLDERLAQLARLHRSLAKERLFPLPVTASDYAGFAREAVGSELSMGAADAFVTACIRSARRHALGWRLAGLWRRWRPAR